MPRRCNTRRQAGRRQHLKARQREFCGEASGTSIHQWGSAKACGRCGRQMGEHAIAGKKTAGKRPHEERITLGRHVQSPSEPRICGVPPSEIQPNCLCLSHGLVFRGAFPGLCHGERGNYGDSPFNCTTRLRCSLARVRSSRFHHNWEGFGVPCITKA